VRKALRTLRSRVGRVQRDVQRQLGALPEKAQLEFQELLQRTGRILTQRTKGLVVGMRSMPGNPYDGHTLVEALEQVGFLMGTDKPPHTAIVDKGYRGVEIEGVRILRSGQKRGVTQNAQGHDQAQKCHRAGDWAHEDGRAAGPQPAQGSAGRCPPCSDVRRWAQPAPDPGRPATLLDPIRSESGGRPSVTGTATDLAAASIRLKNNCSDAHIRADSVRGRHSSSWPLGSFVPRDPSNRIAAIKCPDFQTVN